MSRHAPKGKIKGDGIDDDPMSGRDPMSAPCSATSKATGKPCGRTAIPGGSVCRYHGGAAPQVKAKAMERLMALQAPAVDTLSWLMKKRAKFPSTAYAAARDVLDRTEGKATETTNLNVSGSLDIVSVLKQRHERHRASQ